jgi:adenylate cyclase
MSGKLLVRVLERQRELLNRDFDGGAIELGRQSDEREDLYAPQWQTVRDGPRKGTFWRVAIAPLKQDTVSRYHAFVEALEGNRIRLTNRSAKVPLRLLPADMELPAGSHCELSLPAEFDVSNLRVQVRSAERDPNLRGLETRLGIPGTGDSSRTVTRFPSGLAADHSQLEELLRWLQTTLEVLQSAVTSSEFFHKAAQAVVDLVGLDSGRVLLLEDGLWKVVSVCTGTGITVSAGWEPSTTVMAEVVREKKTFWQAPPVDAKSLRGVEMVVAAPILRRDGTVIGALYGECREESPLKAPTRLTRTDAMLVEVLASGVANGLARLEQEKAVLEADARFRQFFTPELSRQLALQPDLLSGRDCQVSLLFCDIRGFSRISERLGPAGTVEWIGDVMSGLSDCVLAHRGVLVDYIGDELLAMWGAPEVQPDHATLACRAALDMLDILPQLNEKWKSKLGEPFSVGIGVNTGTARVGNTGSTHKFKYGPLGHTVNLASRVQGATKYLRCRLLITEFTHAQLGSGFDTRRLCKVHVVNIAQPVSLFELSARRTVSFAEIKPVYEAALARFEVGEFRACAQELGNLLSAHPDDGPALVLMGRAINHLVLPPERFDPVWELPGK